MAELTFHEALAGSEADRAALLDIHAELFPHYAYYQPYMRERVRQPPDANPRVIEHWWLVRVDGKPAGVRFFNYVPARDCGLGLAIGIRPAFRSIEIDSYRRLSETVLHATLHHLKVDARAAGRPVPVGKVAEVEDYIWPRWANYGFVRLPVAYQEPSFVQNSVVTSHDTGPETITFRPMTLGCLPLEPDTFDASDPAMLTNVVKAFLVDYYGLAEDHEVVQQVLSSIQTSEKE